jgi:hypothetical protein
LYLWRINHGDDATVTITLSLSLSLSLTIIGLFGTFILNSDQERRDSLLRLFTKSFWSHVLESGSKYFNPFFTPVLGAVIPDTNTRAIQLWELFYLHWYNNSLRTSQFRKVRTGLVGKVSCANND